MRSLSALRATWATTSGEEDCLLVVDVGGATTDVYSYGWGRPASPDIVYRGLPEPLEKRTVEADLGVRYTLASLVEQMDSEAVARDGGLTTAQLEQWVSTATGDTARLPASPVEQAADTVLAQAACHLAVTRHCGNLEEVWTPQGRVLIQQGKDQPKLPSWPGREGRPLTTRLLGPFPGRPYAVRGMPASCRAIPVS